MVNANATQLGQDVQYASFNIPKCRKLCRNSEKNNPVSLLPQRVHEKQPTRINHIGISRYDDYSISNTFCLISFGYNKKVVDYVGELTIYGIHIFY